jgi:hypothetical protein
MIQGIESTYASHQTLLSQHVLKVFLNCTTIISGCQGHGCNRYLLRGVVANADVS